MRTEMALKESLLEIISCMLSPNSDLRTLAEERKKALEVTDEYAVHLMEILLTSEEALEERQMAGTLLKYYVRNHWNAHGTEFVAPVASCVVKNRIRTILPDGLSDAISKIRSNIALVLVSIAEIDFPHDWPDMCETVFVRLHNADSNTCSGVLEFIKELNQTDNYYLIYNYSYKTYPLLYEVAQNTVTYDTKIRADAISLFGSTCALVTLDREKRPDVCTLFSEFCYMCKNQLVLPHPDESDYYLKAAILKSYSLLVCQAKEDLTDPMINILPTVWQILFRCGQMFDEMLVNETFPHRDPSESVDESPRFYTLVYNMLELLYVLLTCQLAKLEISAVMSDLLYYLILFMGIPKDVEDRWRSDSNLYFSEDFNDESSNSTVRQRAKDLLMIMARELHGGSLLNALTVTVNKHTTVCKLKNESYYWRVMEAVMFAIGSLKTYIINRYTTEQMLFDIHGYLTQWAKDMGPCPTWFMAARIMWVGGCYALIMEADILSSYLMDTIHNLREPSYILRYSAIRAISLHVAAIAVSKHRAMYMEIRHSMSHALMYAIDHSEGYVLHVGLFALELLLNLPPPFIETVQHEVITLITNVFMRNITRPEFITDCQPIVKSLTVSAPCREALETKFLPIITNLINQSVPQPGAATMFEAQSTAIDILNVIVKYSQEPLSDNILRYGFMAVYTSILTVDDPIITQSGAHCLRSYLCKGATQIASFTDNEGRTGADYILDVLKYVLDPNKMELACKQVGRFFITALHMLGPQLQPHIDFLLRAVLSSVQRANTVRVEESLLIIFAYLFYYHLEAALNYLTSIPGPDGQSALVFILDKWLSKNYNYGGKYSANLNVLAFTRLIEHTILQQDQRVADIKVLDSGSSTPLGASDSDTDLDNYCAEIPVILKLIKHLLYVLQRETELAECGGRPVISVGSSEISLLGVRAGPSREPDSVGAMYELYKKQAKMDSATDDTESDCCDILHFHLDPLDATDPIYNMKITEFLTNFFKNFSENAIFMEYLQYLPNCDKKALCSVGVNINGVEDLEGGE